MSRTPASRQSAELTVERQPRVEVPDAAPQEAADLVPAVADHARRAGGRRPCTAPTPRAGARRAEGRTRATRSCPLGARRGRAPPASRRVVDVTEQVGDRQRVERLVVEGKLLGASLDQADAFVAGCERDSAAASSSISALWSMPTTAQPFRRTSSSATARRSGGDVENHGPAGPTSIRSTRKRRQRGSWPSESRLAYRSYVGPSGAKSRRAAWVRGDAAWAIGSSRQRVAAGRAGAHRRSWGAAGAAPVERLSGILATEPSPGVRVYLCAFEDGEGTGWLALDAAGGPVVNRQLVREAASIAALCEVAEETAGGGDLDELLARLVALRVTEAPEGIDEAEAAVRNLQRSLEAPPRVASPTYLERARRRRAGSSRRSARRLSVRRGDEARDGRGRGADRRDRTRLQRGALVRSCACEAPDAASGACPTPSRVRLVAEARQAENGPIAFAALFDSPLGIFVRDADGNRRQLTSGESDLYPTWSPDGEQIAFVRGIGHEGLSQLYVMDADGGALRVLGEAVTDSLGIGWSPDGGEIVFGDGKGISKIKSDGTGLTELTRGRRDRVRRGRPTGGPSCSRNRRVCTP